MGLSYNPKPDFIERMIEASAHQFFVAFARFAEAGALTEIGEKSGFSPRVLLLLDEARVGLARAAELYDSLLVSIEYLEVQAETKSALQTFDLEGLRRHLLVQNSAAVVPSVFAEFEAAVRSGNPTTVIRVYARRIGRTQALLDTFKASIASGTLDAVAGHCCLTSFIETTTYGQYVATLNRLSREGTLDRRGPRDTGSGTEAPV
ncbi:MAG: hypothetical protein ACK4NE_07530 [Albidovulum sp.]